MRKIGFNEVLVDPKKKTLPRVTKINGMYYTKEHDKFLGRDVRWYSYGWSDPRGIYGTTDS